MQVPGINAINIPIGNVIIVKIVTKKYLKHLFLILYLKHYKKN